MSHFYSAITESARKTVPTARGHKTTGIKTYAASWAGRIEVELWHDDKAGLDRYRVTQAPHHGAGCSRLLAEGVVGADESGEV